jgi:hypothetical protein
MTKSQRTTHNEELRYKHTSPYIAVVMKLGHVTYEENEHFMQYFGPKNPRQENI